VSVPGIFALRGSATDDGLPAGTLSIQWSQVSGPSTAVFGDASQPVTSVTLDLPGPYVLRLAANDGELSASSDVTVVGIIGTGGGNQPPFVDAGQDQIIALPNPAVLNGVAFDDGLPNGTLDISWSVLSGPGTVVFADPTNAKTTATFSAAGDYVLRLSASDSQLTSTAAVTFTNPTSTSTFAIFTGAGTYVLRLTATDTQLASSADISVVINPPINLPPSITQLTVPGQVFLPTNTATFTAVVDR
jgi:hypothetical protein